MKKKCSAILGLCCYMAGLFASLYVGIWLMILVPLGELLEVYRAGELTFTFVAVSLLKIFFSTTFAGLLWCIGYIGYNYFKGTEDPDWSQIEQRNRKEHT